MQMKGFGDAQSLCLDSHTTALKTDSGRERPGCQNRSIWKQTVERETILF